jgi:putative membrane protein
LLKASSYIERFGTIAIRNTLLNVSNANRELTMKSNKLAGTVFVAVLSVGTVAVIAGQTLSPSAQTQQPTAVAPQDHEAKEKLKDDTFIAQAALNGMAEVEISKLAAAKATNPKLKKYATAAVKDQTANNLKLKQIAAQNRLDIPEKLQPQFVKMINELNSLSGAEFDKNYINLMKKSQDTTVALFDNAAGEPTLNVELRVFANQTLPALRSRQKNTHTLIETNDQLSLR